MGKIYETIKGCFAAGIKVAVVAAALLGGQYTASAQHILFVNDNDNILYNTDTIKNDLDHSMYSGYKYWSVPDSAGAVPSAAFMDTFSLVIWYCSTDGVGLKFWDASSTNCNAELLSFASSGKPVWVIGTDVLYQKYPTTSTTFAAGEFAKTVMGLTSYDVQSYADDASTGCPQVDRTSTASTLFPASLQWIFTTAWYVDGCTPEAGTRSLYQMAPASYALAGRKCMFHNKQPGISFMSTFFDPALISTYSNRVAFMEKGITYLLGFLSVGNTGLASGTVLYPNPATSAFTLELNSVRAKNATVELYNGVGAKVYEQQIMLSTGKNAINTPIAGLATGMYVVKVTDVEGKVMYTGNVAKQ